MKTPCQNLGKPVGLASCPSCRGTTLFVFECLAHVSCTKAKQVMGHACCEKCLDYRPLSQEK